MYIGRRNKRRKKVSLLEDNRIVQLYWERSKEAVPATASKYGKYCTSIAMNITGSREDAEECVNDVYLNAWNSMPPHRPEVLSAFLGKLTRNISFNRYKYNAAEKRGGGELPLVFDELAGFVSGKENVECEFDRKELVKAIDAFLAALPPVKRSIFVCRYWYTDSISSIAVRHGMKEGAVSMTLNRLRAKLRKYLSERGFEL